MQMQDDNVHLGIYQNISLFIIIAAYNFNHYKIIPRNFPYHMYETLNDGIKIPAMI